MEWIESLREAISYIEENITEDLTIDSIAARVYISPFYFQKGFAMLTGYTVGEYIRRRRLSLAGRDLIATDERVIDIAMKYGYDSQDSFTKAFTRFHGVTPTAVRKGGGMIKSFAPLKNKLILEGGFTMDYKIEEKEAFEVIGLSKVFKNDTALNEIPGFWRSFMQGEKSICGMYGICFDVNMGVDSFEYMIADDHKPDAPVPEGYVKKVIPKHTWAVFACKGPMPYSIQDTNRKIYSEWLPNCRDYEIAAGYNIEMYTDITKYPKGNQDEEYYSEIWIPVKKK